MIFKRFDADFFTATILEWRHLLKPDKYKNIIIESLQYLVKERRIIINAFVIMDNHIHLIWQIIETPQEKGCSKGFFEIYSSKNQI